MKERRFPIVHTTIMLWVY